MMLRTLSLQLLSQLSLPARVAFQLGALVLEPRLDLVRADAQLFCQHVAPRLGQVSVGLELAVEPCQLQR